MTRAHEVDPLRERDLEAAAGIVLPALGASWTPDALRGELTRTGALALASRSGDELIGCALGWVVVDELEISVVAVAPQHRRAGLGRALLSAFLAEAFVRGARTAFLDVRAGNTAALALYRGAGFEETGRRAAYYADGEDAVLMRRALDG